MKKNIIISISVIIAMLIGVSTYAYINNKKLSSYIDESTILRKKIILLGDLRTDIVKCSQNQKLYILTEKQEYKEEFNDNINESYNLINDMYEQNFLSDSEKKKLIFTLDNYKSINQNYFNKTYSDSISDLETVILSYNNQQLEVLKDITLEITSESENFSEVNDKINSLSSIQTKLIQGVSSLITIFMSGVLYYFKKILKKDNIDVDDILNYLTTGENEIPTTNNTNSLTKDTPNLDELKSRINEKEILIDNTRLLYMQSLKLKDQCEKSDIILSQIDSSVRNFKITLDKIEDYPIETQKIILNDIENQLINLKILFKSLPYFNEFIIDISKNMMSK